MDLTLPSIASQLIHAHTQSPNSRSTSMTLPHPASSPHSRMIDLVDRETPDPKGKDKTRSDRRPNTPLDFFTQSPVPQAVIMQNSEDRRALRTSFDQGRPSVDPAIKGIPQGWDDDPAMPLPSSAHPHHTQPASPPLHTPSASHLARQRPFHDTRVKLSSFSGLVKEGWRERDVSRGSSTLRVQNASTRSHADPRHLPSRSIHSDSSFKTQTTSDMGRSPIVFPVLPPSQTEITEDSTEFTSLFSPSPTGMTAPEYPASAKSETSTASRDRVLGIRKDPINPAAAQSKVFLPPHVSDVLPFAAGHPFAAWSVPSEEYSQVSSEKGAGGRRPSLPFNTLSVSEVEEVREGWKEPITRRGKPGRKVWVGISGEEVGGVYRVGWERDVLDLEGRLHETMYEVAGNRHSFTEFATPPTAVLDIGTGIGLWPISQALEWPEASFVGLDLVPCQTNLTLLADAERTARSTSAGIACGLGMWESVEKRILWQRADFLTELPFDTGVFDLVHIRFVGLGVPEARWGDLLEEASRVLKRGGKLEIVEMSYTLPTSAPTSLKNSFASLLLSDMVQPLPLLPLRFNLPSLEFLTTAEATKPRFERTWRRGEVPGALEDAVLVWVRSALDYKGTGLVNIGGKGMDGVLSRVKKDLAEADRNRWNFDCQVEGQESPEGEVLVWAWVVTKK